MKSKKKTLSLLICAVLLVVGSVMGTMAYLTSQTEVATNTFTVGEVKITLDEAKVDEYGVVDATAGRVTENTYKLIPGHEYTKDPIIHVAEGSENCYVFAEVVDGLAAIEADKTVATQMTELGWKQIAGTNVWYQEAAVAAGADVVVFESFTLTDDAAVADYADARITITGYAVQADGFDSALDAWNDTYGKQETN